MQEVVLDAHWRWTDLSGLPVRMNALSIVLFKRRQQEAGRPAVQYDTGCVTFQAPPPAEGAAQEPSDDHRKVLTDVNNQWIYCQ